MARKLDQMQKAELVEFLEELYRLGGYETQAQWARDAGYHTVNLSKALNRSNTDGIDGYTMLRLMRSATARAEQPLEVAVARSGAEDEPPAWARSLFDRLQSVEDQVAELPTAEDLQRGLESVRRSIARASRGTPATPPVTRKKKAAR